MIGKVVDDEECCSTTTDNDERGCDRVELEEWCVVLVEL